MKTLLMKKMVIIMLLLSSGAIGITFDFEANTTGLFDESNILGKTATQAVGVDTISITVVSDNTYSLNWWNGSNTLNGSDALVAGETSESSYAITLKSGNSFDLTSLYLGDMNGSSNLTFTSSKGDLAYTVSSINQFFDVSAHGSATDFQGIIEFTITGTDLGIALDDIVLSNITASNSPVGATINSADLAIIGYNIDGDDDFAIVALADIPENSVIFVTDEGWDDADFTFTSSEDVIKWTIPSGGISGGTIVRFTNSGSAFSIVGASHGTVEFSGVSGGDMNLAAGDQLFIYQTADDTYNGTIQRKDGSGSTEDGLIYAFNADTSNNNSYGWMPSGNAHSASSTQLPDNMTALTTSDGSGNANSANANGMLTMAALKDTTAAEYDNYRYDGSITQAPKEEWLKRIHTTANWIAQDTVGYSLTSGSLTSDWAIGALLRSGYWTGTLSTVWTATGNWEDGVVPTSGDTVLIQPTSHPDVGDYQPIISADQSCST